MLAETDSSVVAAWATVLGILITTVGGVIVEMLRRQGRHQRQAAVAATVAADSVGLKNGHGSLQDQMAALRQQVLDGEDKRQKGQRRQMDMQEAIQSTQDMVATLRTHVFEESAATVAAVDALRAAIARLDALIGEPQPGDDPTPLLPYVHTRVHALANDVATIQLAQSTAMRQAEALLAEARAVLAEIERHRDT